MKNSVQERKQAINTDNINMTPAISTEQEKETLDSPITKKEIDDALSQLKNNPGTDGYSA